ncbi:MAG: hypothetical protein WBM26_16870, partial [Polyangiales bacterium]
NQNPLFFGDPNEIRTRVTGVRVRQHGAMTVTLPLPPLAPHRGKDRMHRADLRKLPIHIGDL